MNRTLRILKAAIPVVVILVGFSAVAAFAGTGDMGALAVVQQPAGQGNQAMMWIGIAITVIGIVAAGISYFHNHNLAIAGGSLMLAIFGGVLIKNALAFTQALPGTGALF